MLRKDTQVWENDVLMIRGLQAYKTTGYALTQNSHNAWKQHFLASVHFQKLNWRGFLDDVFKAGGFQFNNRRGGGVTLCRRSK